MKNDTDLLLRVRKDKMSRVKNDTDLLLRVIQDNRVELGTTQTCSKSKRRVE